MRSRARRYHPLLAEQDRDDERAEDRRDERAHAPRRKVSEDGEPLRITPVEETLRSEVHVLGLHVPALVAVDERGGVEQHERPGTRDPERGAPRATLQKALADAPGEHREEDRREV